VFGRPYWGPPIGHCWIDNSFRRHCSYHSASLTNDPVRRPRSHAADRSEHRQAARAVTARKA
jgi:hypothetical protein